MSESAVSVTHIFSINTNEQTFIALHYGTKKVKMWLLKGRIFG